MKKAISIWSFVEQSVRESMTLAKKAGFKGIELALNETGEISMDANHSDMVEIKEYSDCLGLKIHSLATGLYWSYSFTSEDETQREKAYEVAVRQIEAAKTLGADSVLIIPGHVSVSFAPALGVIPYDVAYNRALEGINRLKRIAEKNEINVGLENVWNNFLLSPLEMRDFVDEINSSYIGVYFDVGNVVATGHPEHWIKILGSRIKKVHFKDYRINPGGLGGFVDLLSGDVNWPEVMNAFEEIGYDSWVTAEMLPPYKFNADQIVYNTSQSMDRIFGGTENA
ncbi:MAG: sugar phosphate isomerase/epimerase [Clostridia bacterium]|nr:sugar phosphate isomerase/epimerase [Clostridia bacterium]MBN2884090.1 sugar phosphate isomerase/epimerase [Clostridia bacterium]